MEINNDDEVLGWHRTTEQSLDYKRLNVARLRELVLQRNLASEEGEVSSMDRRQLTDLLLVTRRIFEKWTCIRKVQFIKGLKVKAMIT